jgi:hypothetical protein
MCLAGCLTDRMQYLDAAVTTASVQLSLQEHAMLVTAPSTNRQLFTTAVWVQYQVRSCEVYGGRSGTGGRFLRFLGFPSQFWFHQMLHFFQLPSGVGTMDYLRPACQAAVREPRVKGTSAVGSRYQATASGDYSP